VNSQPCEEDAAKVRPQQRRASRLRPPVKTHPARLDSPQVHSKQRSHLRLCPHSSTLPRSTFTDAIIEAPSNSFKVAHAICVHKVKGAVVAAESRHSSRRRSICHTADFNAILHQSPTAEGMAVCNGMLGLGGSGSRDGESCSLSHSLALFKDPVNGAISLDIAIITMVVFDDDFDAPPACYHSIAVLAAVPGSSTFAPEPREIAGCIANAAAAAVMPALSPILFAGCAPTMAGRQTC
jgi:hypothetical protein